MLRFCIVIGIIWLALFLIRLIIQGGLQQDYQDSAPTLLEPLQSTLDAKIHQLLPDPSASLLSGMLIGVQGKIPYLFKKKLQATSTIHLLVVSGQNLSLVAVFINKLLQPLGKRKSSYMTAFVIFIYSILTGFGVPVIRALIMSLITIAGQLLGRERLGWWILMLTAGIMLLIEPNWLQSISFQLSFLATAGAVIASKPLEASLKAIPEIIRGDFAVSLAAQLLTLPIIAANFQQISIIGIVVNVLVLWIVSPVMVLGSIGLLLGFIHQPTAELVLILPNILLIYFVKVINFAASFGWAAIMVPSVPIVVWLGYYIVLIMVHLRHAQGTNRGRSKKNYTTIGLGIN